MTSRGLSKYRLASIIFTSLVMRKLGVRIVITDWKLVRLCPPEFQIEKKIQL